MCSHVRTPVESIWCDTSWIKVQVMIKMLTLFEEGVCDKMLRRQRPLGMLLCFSDVHRALLIKRLAEFGLFTNTPSISLLTEREPETASAKLPER